MKPIKLTHTRELIQHACGHRVSTLLPVDDPPGSGERERARTYLEHQGQCRSCELQGKPLPNPGMVMITNAFEMTKFVR